MSGPLQVAVGFLAVAVGLLLSRPVLTGRPRGSRWVALLLGVDAGVVLVAGIVLAAAAGRSWQLLGEPDRPTGQAVLDISGSDGDGSLYALLIVVIGLLTLLLTLLLATATRSVEGTQPGDRALVSTVLGVEAVLAAVALVRLLTGAGAPVEAVVAAHLPLAVGGLVLQRRHAPTRPGPQVGPARLPG